MCACVCVCVWVWEREREKERKMDICINEFTVRRGSIWKDLLYIIVKGMLKYLLKLLFKVKGWVGWPPNKNSPFYIQLFAKKGWLELIYSSIFIPSSISPFISFKFYGFLYFLLIYLFLFNISFRHGSSFELLSLLRTLLISYLHMYQRVLKSH